MFFGESRSTKTVVATILVGGAIGYVVYKYLNVAESLTMFRVKGQKKAQDQRNRAVKSIMKKVSDVEQMGNNTPNLICESKQAKNIKVVSKNMRGLDLRKGARLPDACNNPNYNYDPTAVMRRSTNDDDSWGNSLNLNNQDFIEARRHGEEGFYNQTIGTKRIGYSDIRGTPASLLQAVAEGTNPGGIYNNSGYVEGDMYYYQSRL